MSQLVDARSKPGVLGSHETPPGFPLGLALAEYVRQTYHLFSGDIGERKVERTRAKSLLLWCLRRTAQFKTMQIALFPAESERPLGHELAAILGRCRPDAATIRVMSRSEATTAAPPRLQIAGRYLLLSLGREYSVELLPLGDNFELFLATLGKKTRSHTRSSLRTFAREGYEYRFDSPAQVAASPDIQQLSMLNMPDAPPLDRVEILTSYINQQALPFQSTLSAPDGAIISIIRGYLVDDHANLVDQINLENYPKIGQTGPSLLHRALLIEALIERGIRGLIVAGGCGGMLRRYCRPAVFDSYLALHPNPLSLLRVLRYFARNRNMGRWAIGHFLGRKP